MNVMKLSNETIQILRWCAMIQSGLVIDPGNRIKTISNNKATFLDAQIAETFPSSFILHEAKRILTLIKANTEIVFTNEEFIELRNDRTCIRIPHVDRTLVLAPPERSITISQYDESVFLHHDDVYEIRKLRSKGTVIEFYADKPGDEIAVDSFVPNAKHSFVRTMHLTTPSISTKPFRARLMMPNVRLVEGSYRVEFSARGVARFTWLNGPVMLFIAVESRHSWFGSKLQKYAVSQ